jgi:phosphatidylglycerol:prolipoprotein diacylglycerol transferase
VFRFIAEFFREPDSYLSWLPQSTGLSMGQWLCVPMIVIGIGLWVFFGRGSAGVVART